ncbi:helix-turn-helix domain-containing protein [Microbacterium sp. NPDC055910]|uniref:helix-turn-helix domain-containing protein n=1 Tax=Microbacterium sp. NPDC055910 TaxID=3345659 RepID=UPI0035E29EA4
MTTSVTSMTQEEAFGRAVAFWRGQRELSQRQLADRLTVRGMKLDAPAVSRIESGARSVRLTEAMLIAEVMDLELDALVGFALSPPQQLHRLRRAADSAMNELEPFLQRWLNRLAMVREFLVEHPDLLANLPDAEGDIRPDQPDEYFDWVQQRLGKLAVSALPEDKKRARVDNEMIVIVESEQERSDLVELAAEYARAQVLLWTEVPEQPSSTGTD